MVGLYSGLFSTVDKRSIRTVPGHREIKVNEGKNGGEEKKEKKMQKEIRVRA